MIPLLDINAPFPLVCDALDDPNGLLAAGADLSVSRLIDAYAKGIFPWYSKGEPILWWSPEPRTVIFTEGYKPSKSLCRFVKQSNLTVTLNKNFEKILQACAEPRNDHSGTWITEEMKQAYLRLHFLGYAHSVEVWQEQQLVGGIYGVALGKYFCGESMFSRISNASKVALSCLIAYLGNHDFPLIDCQVENPHLLSLGSVNLKRSIFLTVLEKAQSQWLKANFWHSKTLDVKSLVRREWGASTE